MSRLKAKSALDAQALAAEINAAIEVDERRPFPWPPPTVPASEFQRGVRPTVATSAHVAADGMYVSLDERVRRLVGEGRVNVASRASLRVWWEKWERGDVSGVPPDDVGDER